MTEDLQLIISPLEREITQDGHTVEVRISRSPGTQWSLEVVNSVGTSTVWGETFKTDQEALDEVLGTIERDGMGEFIEHDPENPVH